MGNSSYSPIVDNEGKRCLDRILGTKDHAVTHLVPRKVSSLTRQEKEERLDFKGMDHFHLTFHDLIQETPLTRATFTAFSKDNKFVTKEQAFLKKDGSVVVSHFQGTFRLKIQIRENPEEDSEIPFLVDIEVSSLHGRDKWGKMFLCIKK